MLLIPKKSDSEPETQPVIRKLQNLRKDLETLDETGLKGFRRLQVGCADDELIRPDINKEITISPTDNTVNDRNENENISESQNWHICDNIRAVKDEMHRVLYAFVDSRTFSSYILIVILLNTVMLISQTVPEVSVRLGWQIAAADNVFLSIYILEAVFKLIAYGRGYFADAWNILDFSIVSFSVGDFLLPFVIQNVSFNAASIFRVLRIFRAVRALRALRVLRTIRFLNTLQVILVTLFQSIRSIGAIVVLILLFMCIFSVVGRDLYSKSAPEYFGNLFLAFFTLFQLLTLDDWFEIYQTVISRDKSQIHVIIFLLLYIVVEYFVFLNLFVAVLVDNFQLTILSQKKKDKNVEKDSDDEDHSCYYKAESSISMDPVTTEQKKRTNIFGHYPKMNRIERMDLKNYLQLLTAYESTAEVLHSYEKMAEIMVAMCSDAAEIED